jgi:hypothetical protein
MAAAKTFHGARALVSIADPNGTSRLIGIFNSISWGLTYDVQPISILGRLSPDELVYTAQEPVSITCSGFRVVGHGAHEMAKVPNLLDLLSHEYLEIVVTDRQDPTKAIAKFHSVRPTGYSTTLSARNVEEITVTYMGLLVDDESTTNAEPAQAATLP